MQKKHCLIVLGLVAFSLAASAQKINTDSLTHVSRISDYQLKRAKLQNTVDKTIQEKQDAASKVQNSADQNREDASRLSNDPQNKRLARNADNSASDAKRDSKRARSANNKLDDLNKEIAKLDVKIASEQTKLNVYRNVAVLSQPVIETDTSHEQKQ